MNTIANRNPSENNPAAVLDTVSKFFRLLTKNGVELSHFDRPNNSVMARRNLAEYLKAGCPKVTDNGEIVTPSLPEGEDLCRLILGDDYLSPEDVADLYSWSYSDDQLENFANTLPDTETVLWLRSNGYMLVATPSTDRNILQVRNLYSSIFYGETESWYAKGQQKYASNDVVKAGEWLMVRKEPYADSLSKTWDEQTVLLTDVEHVPSAPEMAYAIITYYNVRHIYLLNFVHVRTSSVSDDGRHVNVGEFNADEGCLVVASYRNHRDDYVGVSSSRKALIA